MNCGARKKSEGLCKHPAGWGTDHVGEGRCKLHGGSSPVKHGRYSKIRRPRIKELLEQLEHDPDPMDLLPEVVLLRSLVIDYVERYDELTEALLGWHKSWGKKDETAKPRQMLDILSASRFIADIGGLVERIQKQKDARVITLAQVNQVVAQLGVDVVNAALEQIPDASQRAALLDAVEAHWGRTIRVHSGSPGPGGAPQGTQVGQAATDPGQFSPSPGPQPA